MAKFQIDKLEDEAKDVLNKGEQNADELVEKVSQALQHSKYTMWITLGGLIGFGAFLVWALAR